MPGKPAAPRSAADRQRDYRNRQAAVLRAPLDKDHVEWLAEILADSGESASAWVRRMIREQSRQARRSAMMPHKSGLPP